MTSKTRNPKCHRETPPKSMNYNDVLIDNVGAKLGVGPVIPSNIISTTSS